MLIRSDIIDSSERAAQLAELQKLPLNEKVQLTIARIIEWYEHYDGKVYVSFSGGKDSTVLLDIARKIYPDIPAVYVDTGLEYPEIRKFVKTFDNVEILRPKMSFPEVITKYGYPLISKDVSNIVYYATRGSGWANTTIRGLEHDGTDYGENAFKKRYIKYIPLLDTNFRISNRCCHIMKESPLKMYSTSKKSHPIIGITSDESVRRRESWMKHGCNAFNSKYPSSKPLSFWIEQDVLKYIKNRNLPIASVYGEIIEDKKTGKLITTGEKRTGCMFCAYGLHLDKGETKFQRMKETHPKQYDYCINGGQFDGGGSWVPSKEGLGMGYVFDEINMIYGENFIRYK